MREQDVSQQNESSALFSRGRLHTKQTQNYAKSTSSACELRGSIITSADHIPSGCGHKMQDGVFSILMGVCITANGATPSTLVFGANHTRGGSNWCTPVLPITSWVKWLHHRWFAPRVRSDTTTRHWSVMWEQGSKISSRRRIEQCKTHALRWLMVNFLRP